MVSDKITLMTTSPTSHPHFHIQDALWKIDHKAWRYCSAIIMKIDAAKQEQQNRMLIKDNKDNNKDNNKNDNSTAEEDTTTSIRLPSCFKNSTDPRHDGRIPLCGDIRYSAWRLVKDCEYCRDYWIGRSMENAF
ncbi:hypothetical protein Daus18300_014210 [Diaporthe australafricana]|uniref:Uncharacterized protein n=1 Tax=Diaporthe australafricana TaxID=127596 RepID=A0ABR3VW40_9PEZI